MHLRTLGPSGRRGLGPAFTNLFTASLASNLGDGIARTAVPLLAARLTDDPLLISGIAAMAMLPWLLCAIPAGILIDRIDRRIALALANTVRMLLAVALCVLTATGGLTIGWLYLVIFVYGAFETVYDGATRAVVPSIVGRIDLPRANSRIEAGELVVQNFVAGPLTSILFAVSVLIPLGVNALVFVIAAGLALLLPRIASGRQHAVEADEEVVPWYRQFVDGYRFIVKSRMLVTLWCVSTAGGLAFSFASASFVLFVLGPLRVPEAWFGVFMLSGAVGGIVASVYTAPLKNRLNAGPAMALMFLLSGATLMVVGIWPNVWVTAVFFALSSGAITVWNILVMSLRQSIIPGHLLGRVHGTWRTLLWGAMPVGSLLGGLVGRIDLALPFIVGGALATVIALVFYRFISTLPNAEDVPDPLGPLALVRL
ncbi:MFS transporter [Cryobacterium frigoriphilum]|uniref:MFS transporter n=1 Tax=Cryobacterium frigoriphilum TaxID=1259150 RepID=A0A4R8ZT35_9MICO|nr:MFS transporter [Cryobacterium frigoriphilum]TFD44757.1 MFS transporter [Cryobacterium frigoriphilum]